MSDRQGLNRALFWLYEGTGRGPYLFRWAFLVFDAATIAYFLWAPFQNSPMAHSNWDYVIGVVIALDLAARFYIAKSKARFFTRVMNWADFVVVVTMFAPLFLENFAFLRVLRAVRALRAFTFLRRLKGVSAWLKARERVFERATNLFVFIFIMGALVYVFQVNVNDNINSYLDALYFTVASLTTTGYGDVTMEGEAGRVLAILIMVLGISLFLRLLRELFRPDDKIEQECPSCGLSRHDPDAVHCKHCGEVVHIQNRGGQSDV